MGNILFDNYSRVDHDRIIRSDRVATTAECPVVRYTIPRGFQSEQGPKSAEEMGVPGSDPGTRTEPVIDHIYRDLE